MAFQVELHLFLSHMVTRSFLKYSNRLNKDEKGEGSLISFGCQKSSRDMQRLCERFPLRNWCPSDGLLRPKRR